MFSFMPGNSVKSVDVNDMESLLGNVELIDIREPYEYAGGHLRTAKNMPMDTLLANLEKYLDKSKEYYIICQSGGRSSMACRVLKANGFNIVNVAGGTGRYMGRLER